MEMFLYLFILLAVVVVFDTGIIHIVWKLQDNAVIENDAHGKTIRNMKPYIMKIQEVKARGFHIRVCGSVQGRVPSGNIPVFLFHNTKMKSARILKIKKLSQGDFSNPDDPVYPTYEMVLFGAKGSLIEKNDQLTNMYTIEQLEVQKKTISQKNIKYPIIIKKKYEQYILGVCLCILALPLMVVIFSKEVNPFADVKSIWILICSALLLLLGVFVFLNTLMFKITVEQNGHIEICTLTNKYVTDIGHLKYNITYLDQKKYPVLITIFNDLGKKIAEVGEGYQGVTSLYYLLKQQKEKSI